MSDLIGGDSGFGRRLGETRSRISRVGTGRRLGRKSRIGRGQKRGQRGRRRS